MNKVDSLNMKLQYVLAGVSLGVWATGLLTAQTPPAPAKKHVLAIGDVRSGFQHDSVSHALSVIDRLGYESGIYVTYIRTDSQLLTKGKIERHDPRTPELGANINAKNLD